MATKLITNLPQDIFDDIKLYALCVGISLTIFVWLFFTILDYLIEKYGNGR